MQNDEKKNVGRPARIEPPAHIHLKVEPAEKSAFVRAAQRSVHKTLSRWMVAAAKNAMTLEKGKIYDYKNLNFSGWTDGDGSGSEGYNVADYFDADGHYLGPDESGIEPTFG